MTSLHPPSFQRNDFSTCFISFEHCELDRKYAPIVRICAHASLGCAVFALARNLDYKKGESLAAVISRQSLCCPANCIFYFGM